LAFDFLPESLLKLRYTTMGRSGETVQPIDDASANPMNPPTDQPWPFPFGKADWGHTPAAVRAYVLALQCILVERQKATPNIFAKKGKLQWLRVMSNAMVAFFMIHPHRSKEAFEGLIRDRAGILVSDGEVPSRDWVAPI
jgi:hypothetical protein